MFHRRKHGSFYSIMLFYDEIDPHTGFLASMNKSSFNRCSWADNKYPEMQQYHDTEWGVPVHQDTRLFEFLVLEGAQAGLSWSTILKKRQDYRRAFDNFDVKRVAEFKIRTVNKLLNSPNSNIVRNRLKIQSGITNAQSIYQGTV